MAAQQNQCRLRCREADSALGIFTIEAHGFLTCVVHKTGAARKPGSAEHLLGLLLCRMRTLNVSQLCAAGKRHSQRVSHKAAIEAVAEEGGQEASQATLDFETITLVSGCLHDEHHRKVIKATTALGRLIPSFICMLSLSYNPDSTAVKLLAGLTVNQRKLRLQFQRQPTLWAGGETPVVLRAGASRDRPQEARGLPTARETPAAAGAAPLLSPPLTPRPPTSRPATPTHPHPRWGTVPLPLPPPPRAPSCQ